MTEARIRHAIHCYIEAWNERDPARRAQLIAQGCAESLELRTPGRRIEGRDQLDAMISDFQTRRPGERAVLSSAIDVQGKLFRYTGVIEGAKVARGDSVDVGACDADGQICLLLTFAGLGPGG